MTSSSPGSFILLGRAVVQNPHAVPGKPHTVILDVSFLTPPEREMDEFICSLRYFKGEEGVVIADGLYDVVATVSLFLAHAHSEFAMTSVHLLKRLSHSVLMSMYQAPSFLNIDLN